MTMEKWVSENDSHGEKEAKQILELTNMPKEKKITNSLQKMCFTIQISTVSKNY